MISYPLSNWSAAACCSSFEEITMSGSSPPSIGLLFGVYQRPIDIYRAPPFGNGAYWFTVPLPNDFSPMTVARPWS